MAEESKTKKVKAKEPTRLEKCLDGLEEFKERLDQDTEGLILIEISKDRVSSMTCGVPKNEAIGTLATLQHDIIHSQIDDNPVDKLHDLLTQNLKAKVMVGTIDKTGKVNVADPKIKN